MQVYVVRIYHTQEMLIGKHSRMGDNTGVFNTSLLLYWTNFVFVLLTWTANSVQRTFATDLDCTDTPKCHAVYGLIFCSHAVAECINNKCFCNKSGYDPCTCMPFVGSCSITRDPVNARATASYLGEIKPIFSCTPSDYNPVYNVHVISNYASNSPALSRNGHTAGAAVVRIQKNSEGDTRPIVLVLVSHQPNNWTLDLSQGIAIDKIVMISYYMDKTRIVVESNKSITEIERLDTIPCGHGDDNSEGNTPKLLHYIQHRFGTLASFTGSHRADKWHLTIISQGDIGRPWFIPVRLVGGGNYMEGRVEVYYDGEWGTVCDDKWDLNNARVVCNQFGYPGPASAFTGGQFGAGVGNILLDNVDCIGDEQTIGRCSHNIIGQHDCKHNEDAGVVCTMGNIETPEVPVRLGGGRRPGEGRVELYHQGAWGTVCGLLDWTKIDASIVCRQLGFFFASGATKNAHRFGQGSGPIFLHNVVCTGLEADLFECAHDEIEEHSCRHEHDAGVVCATSPPDRMDVRLTGGASRNEGVVKLQYFGMWVSACGDHGWDVRDARVVCHQLGYGEAIVGYNPADSMEEGPSGYDDVSNDKDRTKPIITIDRVRCFGNETNIAKCRYEVQFTQKCHFGATVTCHTPRPDQSASEGMTVSSPMFWVCLGIGLLLLALIVFMLVCFFMRRAPPPISRPRRPIIPVDRTPALSAIVTSATRASIPMVSGPAATESLDSVWVPRHQLSRLDEQRPYDALLAKNDALLAKKHMKKHRGQPSYVTTQYTPPRTTLTRPMTPSASITDEENIT